VETSDLVWAGLIAAGSGFEAYALANGKASDTLSETTRRLFHTRTRVGRVVFVGTWAAFASWYLIHITKEN